MRRFSFAALKTTKEKLSAATAAAASSGGASAEEKSSDSVRSDFWHRIRRSGRGNPSIALRVSIASALAVLVFSLAAGGVIFAVAYDEAQEEQDDRLEEVVGMLARSRAVFSVRGRPAFQAFFMDDDVFERRYMMDDDDPKAGLPADTEVLIQTLHRNGRGVRARFPGFLHDGYHTLKLRHHGLYEYRILLRTLKNGTHVIAGQHTDTVLKAAIANTLNVLVPFAFLSVLLGFGIAFLVWRTMRPVRKLADQVRAQSGEKISPIDTSGVPSEINPLITAFNGLLARVDSLREQEARFVADAAHELRSPLAALSLQAEALEKSNLCEADRERLRKLRSGIDRAVRQVSQLLSLKRAQAAPSTDAAPQSASIALAIGEAVESVYWEAEKLGVTIAVEGLEELPAGVEPTLPMKSDDLFTILRNLLENAVRYSPKESTVTVKLISIEPPAITVADQGPGIPEADRKRVLEPFFRRLGTGVSGTGLGLAIVKALCERSNLELTLCDADPSNQTAPGLAATIKPKVEAGRMNSAQQSKS